MKLVRLVLSLFSFMGKPGQFTLGNLLRFGIGKKLGKWKLVAKLAAFLLAAFGRSGVGRGLLAKYWPRFWHSSGRKQVFRALYPHRWLQNLRDLANSGLFRKRQF
jgi:hypothetical protein